MPLAALRAAGPCFTQNARAGRTAARLTGRSPRLDALGLLLFFVPGVVAFVVDFSTGAIYLPLEPSYPEYEVYPQQARRGSWQEVPSQHARILWPTDASSMAQGQPQPVWQKSGLKRIAIPREQLQQQRIEQVATHYVGRQVALDDGQTRLSVLPCIGQYDEQTSRHRSDRNFGFTVQSFFDRLKRGIA